MGSLDNKGQFRLVLIFCRNTVRGQINGHSTLFVRMETQPAARHPVRVHTQVGFVYRGSRHKIEQKVISCVNSLCVQCCRWGAFTYLSFMATSYAAISHRPLPSPLWHPRSMTPSSRNATRPGQPQAPTNLTGLTGRQLHVLNGSTPKWPVSCGTVSNEPISARACASELTHLTGLFQAKCPFKWQAPIGHLIPRIVDFDSYTDACLHGSGGYSTPLGLFWQLEWPDSIQFRTTLHLPPKAPGLLSINLLEYTGTIITFASCILAIQSLLPTQLPPHPLLQIWTDNTLADCWTRKMSSGTGCSSESKSLAHIFCYLLMHWPIGINSAHIAGTKNILADTLSRTLDHTHFRRNSPIAFALPPLQLQIPQIQGWMCYQPSLELLNLVHSALCTGFATIPTMPIPLGQLTHM